MEKFFIGQAKDHPAVVLDFNEKSLRMLGRSMPEDPKEFYSKLLTLLKPFSKDLSSKNETMVFVMRLSYFNSASSKIIQDILESIPPNSVVQWHYDDEDMEDAGKEFKEIIDNKLNFEFIIAKQGVGNTLLFFLINFYKLLQQQSKPTNSKSDLLFLRTHSDGENNKQIAPFFHLSPDLIFLKHPNDETKTPA